MIYCSECEEWPMEPAINAFEILARSRELLGDRYIANFSSLMHPIHKGGSVFAWQVVSGRGSGPPPGHPPGAREPRGSKVPLFSQKDDRSPITGAVRS
jgi:hypothetical protein